MILKKPDGLLVRLRWSVASARIWRLFAESTNTIDKVSLIALIRRASPLVLLNARLFRLCHLILHFCNDDIAHIVLTGKKIMHSQALRAEITLFMNLLVS